MSAIGVGYVYTIGATHAHASRGDFELTRLSAGARAALVLVVAWLVVACIGPVHAAGPAFADQMRRSDAPASATDTPEPVRISQAQGSGATVAITGPVTVEAIVTSLFERDDLLSGFFLQEEDADGDGDPATRRPPRASSSSARPRARPAWRWATG